jgi:phosphatidylethanolamine-binding protein (PEBP) family uncharacterized protein
MAKDNCVGATSRNDMFTVNYCTGYSAGWASLSQAEPNERGIVAREKPGPDAPGGLRHGNNDYENWFAGDAEMRGEYYGYDGPCPPWNDVLRHRYIFTLYAVDDPSLAVSGLPTGENVEKALAGHMLAEATLAGTYTLNPNV